MSSISVADLKSTLEYFPDDYEVIMSITEWSKESEDHKKHSIAYINGISSNKDYKEVYLMN